MQKKARKEEYFSKIRRFIFLHLSFVSRILIHLDAIEMGMIEFSDFYTISFSRPFSCNAQAVFL